MAELGPRPARPSAVAGPCGADGVLRHLRLRAARVAAIWSAGYCGSRATVFCRARVPDLPDCHRQHDHCGDRLRLECPPCRIRAWLPPDHTDIPAELFIARCAAELSALGPAGRGADGTVH